VNAILREAHLREMVDREVAERMSERRTARRTYDCEKRQHKSKSPTGERHSQISQSVVSDESADSNYGCNALPAEVDLTRI
jgi:hypothetical protein